MTAHKLPRDDQLPSTSSRDLLDARTTDDDIEYYSEAETLVGLECNDVSPPRLGSPTDSQLSGGDEVARNIHTKKPYSLYQTNVEPVTQSSEIVGILEGRRHTPISQPGRPGRVRPHRPYGPLSEEELRHCIEELRRFGHTIRFHADYIDESTKFMEECCNANDWPAAQIWCEKLVKDIKGLLKEQRRDISNRPVYLW